MWVDTAHKQRRQNWRLSEE